MVRRLLRLCLGLGPAIWWVSVAVAQEPTPEQQRERGAGSVRTTVSTTQAAAESAVLVQSDAERVSQLTRTIEEGENRLTVLKARLEDPQDEYFKAEADFKQVDGAFEAKQKEIAKLNEAGRTSEVDSQQAELDALTQRRQLAKERFDLAIQERKTLQEQVGTLEQKLQQDREALNKLVAPPPPATQPAAPAKAQGTPVEPAAAGAHPPTEKPALTSALPAADGTTAGSPSGAAQSFDAPPSKPSAPAPPPSKELVKAQEEAVVKDASAAEAQKQVRSVAERMEALLRSIDLERKLLETIRKKAANARDTESTLSDQAQRRWNEGAPQTELRELWTRVSEARERHRQAWAEVEERVSRIDDLEGELRRLQAEQIATLQEAQQKRQEAEKARKKVEQLESPLAPRNLLRWLVERGPRVLGILLGVFVVLWLARRGEAHAVRLLAGRSDRGSPEDRENRARTLVGVLHNAATIAVVTGGGLMVLTELGVNIVPLMGGAAVVGLAVAFGAQNLIRDYFYGFNILLENQYAVNDVVKIGDISGQVERITLRVTILRGLDGTVHFVPNGEITRVSNMTQGWSRALFDIRVAYKEDVDRVMEVLIELAKELRRDPEYRSLILESPEMLGVDSLGDSAVFIKFYLKTRPLKQWIVKREMLRRIKKKFHELNIEIPFPHRTVYHRHGEGEGPDTTGERG